LSRSRPDSQNSWLRSRNRRVASHLATPSVSEAFYSAREMTTKSLLRVSKSSSERGASARKPLRLTKMTSLRRKKVSDTHADCWPAKLTIFSIYLGEEKKTNEGEEESKEEAEGESTEGKEKPNNKDDGSFKERLRNVYFKPGGNDPKPEAWLALLAALACGYLAMTFDPPRKEIVFMTFLNDYLLKNEIAEIKITKDRRSEVFNHRAEIDTHDG